MMKGWCAKMDIINNQFERIIMPEKKPNKTQILTLAIHVNQRYFLQQ